MKKSDNSLLNMLACDMQPLSIVEYPGFMNYINSMGSHARLPSKNTLINTLLPAKYAEVQKTVMLMLSQVNHVALSGDIWLSSNSVEHLCINAHYINNDWEIKSVALGMIFSLSQCSIEELAERLHQLVERWQITKKVSCFVSGRNIKLTTAAKLRNWSHLCCFSDSLNLAVKDSLRANEDLMQLQKACCNLVLLIQSTVLSTTNMGTILEQINFPDVKLACEGNIFQRPYVFIRSFAFCGPLAEYSVNRSFSTVSRGAIFASSQTTVCCSAQQLDYGGWIA